MAVLHQQLEQKKNGTYMLTNVMDMTPAMRLAKQYRDHSNGFTGDRGMQCAAIIPNWMWAWNPWLMEARKARAAGNEAEFMKNFKKFLKLYPEFKVAQNL